MGNRIRELLQNTFQNKLSVHLKVGRQRSDGKSLVFAVFFLLSLIFFLTSCGPKYSYPATKVPESIEDIDRKEYNINSIARVVGKTVGAVVYVDSIVDAKGQVSKDVHETMGKVMQAVTRVALSTDLPLDFCTVVIRDKQHENELVITRSLDDTKRANADAIGIEESINRTVFGQGRYKRDAQNPNSFVLKEVKLESFLSDQIVQRIRFSFSKDANPDEIARNAILLDGLFDYEPGKRAFRFSVISIKNDDPKKIVMNIFRITSDVLKSYAFKDFDKIEILDYLNRKKLIVPLSVLLDYQQKKITDDQIYQRCLVESQSIQEAFKLFGFNLPQESSSDKDAAVPRPATP